RAGPFAKPWHHERSSVVSFRVEATLVQICCYARPSARSSGTARRGRTTCVKVLGGLPRFLAFGEGKQIGAHLVLVCRAQAVRGPLVDLQGRALDELGLEQAGVRERHDLIVVALNDER